ncbi:hypothetical protein ElyMa_001296200 [Elysia marginata]|uniref:OCRE domain-containing protein n=1 Tax=Elysia marginata TaxID=1093978 RepID=A0AAV4IHN8_9GAST|nr:hypothetical protein ElyMa_001296200 [Elysia marginata]
MGIVKSGIPEFADQAVEDRPGYVYDPDAAGILHYTDRDHATYREFLQKQSEQAHERAAVNAVANLGRRTSSSTNFPAQNSSQRSSYDNHSSNVSPLERMSSSEKLEKSGRRDSKK